MFSHLSALPPLIADGSPGQPSTPLSPPLHVQTAFLDPDQPNPHQPIILSELFQLTSTLYERFPPDHPAIRANELLGSASVILTYEDGEKHGGMSIQEAADLVAGGLEKADVIVDPQPEDSDSEDMPIRRQRSVRRRRFNLGTSIAIAVLFVGIGIAVYQKRHRLSLIRSVVHRWMPKNLNVLLRRYDVI